MSRTCAWPTSKLPQSIASGQIHVWTWPLNSPNIDLASDTSLLDEEEASRYLRFHFDRDRVRFAVSHANMRRILGAYLDRPPGQIRFSANRFGKPEVFSEKPGRGTSSPPLRFNLSHSQSVALLALALDIEVGVDVEDIRPIEPEVALGSFSVLEIRALGSLEGDAWLEGFYNCWTRKEAILKAEGSGLSLPLDAFDVSLAPGAPAELLGTRPPLVLRRRWKLHDLSPAPGTAGALAAGSDQASLACFRLAPLE